jgi:hypothetical protein
MNIKSFQIVFHILMELGYESSLQSHGVVEGTWWNRRYQNYVVPSKKPWGELRAEGKG